MAANPTDLAVLALDLGLLVHFLVHVLALDVCQYDLALGGHPVGPTIPILTIANLEATRRLSIAKAF